MQARVPMGGDAYVPLPGGYAGRVLRVDLTTERLSEEKPRASDLRRWVGGSGLGAWTLYREVPPGVQWSDPENRLVIASGPLGGTAVMGSGTFSAVTKGPLTDGAVTTQANGFLGAYLKMAGYDAVVLQGAASHWCYLYLHDGMAELRDASHLEGKDTQETQEAITGELARSRRSLSIFAIGPAGEHLVRFAAIVGDGGHVAGHNGAGAVMGSKRLKAIVAERGRGHVAVHDPQALRQSSERIVQAVLESPVAASIYRWGTSMSYGPAARAGWLPVKNYTTNLFPEADLFLGENYRQQFELRPAPCFACRTKHLHRVKVTAGPYAGFEGEEPEYEQWAAWGALVGNSDLGAAVMLSNEVDRLGLEANEAGWVVAWAIDCFAHRLLSPAQVDGLDLTWGNVEAIKALLGKISRREGVGDLLAEGCRRAAAQVGGEAARMAVFTGRGNTPRGHDHRGRWLEMLDTCLSDTGTIESGVPTLPDEIGVRPLRNPFDWERMGEVLGGTNGRMLFEDCLGVCRFCTNTRLGVVVEAVNAATGWDMSLQEAMGIGRRLALLLRAFNYRHGARFQDERPSPRYGSRPVDGPARDTWAGDHWEDMRRQYYELMGLDLESGRPEPQALRDCGLEGLLPDLWPDQAGAAQGTGQPA